MALRASSTAPSGSLVTASWCDIGTGPPASTAPPSTGSSAAPGNHSRLIAPSSSPRRSATASATAEGLGGELVAQADTQHRDVDVVQVGDQVLHHRDPLLVGVRVGPPAQDDQAVAHRLQPRHVLGLQVDHQAHPPREPVLEAVQGDVGLGLQDGHTRFLRHAGETIHHGCRWRGPVASVGTMATTEFFDELTHALAERARAQRQPSRPRRPWAVRWWTAAVGDADPLATRPRTPTPRTRYRIGSLTKPQVAAAVMMLVEVGTVELGAPMRSYLPDAPAGEATLAQFLSHTSGLVAEPLGPVVGTGRWWPAAGSSSSPWHVAAGLRRGSPRPAQPPLLQPRLCRARAPAGGTGRQAMGRRAQELWQPLGMAQTARTGGRSHATGVAVHPLQPLVHAEPVNRYLAMGPAGELWSTPSDLVVLGSFLAGVGEGRGVAAPRQPGPDAPPGRAGPGRGAGLDQRLRPGLRVQNVDGVVQVMHTGSVPGFTTHLVLDPGTGACLALCGNSTAWHGGVSDWLVALAQLAPTVTGRPHAEAHSSALPDRARALAGLWYRGPRPFLVKVHADQVIVHPTEDPALASRVRSDASGRLVGVSEDLALGEELVVDPEHPDDPHWFTLAGLHHTREPYCCWARFPAGRTSRAGAPCVEAVR